MMNLDLAIMRLEHKAARAEILGRAERTSQHSRMIGEQLLRDAEAIRFLIAEVRRLHEVVVSGILPDLLDEAETAALVDFVQSFRLGKS